MVFWRLLRDFLESFSMVFESGGFLMKKRVFSRSGVSPRREHHFSRKGSNLEAPGTDQNLKK